MMPDTTMARAAMRRSVVLAVERLRHRSDALMSAADVAAEALEDFEAGPLGLSVPEVVVELEELAVEALEAAKDRPVDRRGLWRFLNEGGGGVKSLQPAPSRDRRGRLFFSMSAKKSEVGRDQR